MIKPESLKYYLKRLTTVSITHLGEKGISEYSEQ